MSIYQELSRPYGDVTRWSKVYERLTLLNENHPFYYDVDLTQNNMISNKENKFIYEKNSKYVRTTTIRFVWRLRTFIL